MYRVINTFREKEHENTIYESGDVYPKEGFKADEKRVSFLQKIHPIYGVCFLDSKQEEANPVTEKPKAVTKKKKSDSE